MKSDNTSKSKKKIKDMERNHKAVSTNRGNAHMHPLN